MAALTGCKFMSLLACGNCSSNHERSKDTPSTIKACRKESISTRKLRQAELA